MFERIVCGTPSMKVHLSCSIDVHIDWNRGTEHKGEGERKQQTKIKRRKRIQTMDWHNSVNSITIDFQIADGIPKEHTQRFLISDYYYIQSPQDSDSTKHTNIL